MPPATDTQLPLADSEQIQSSSSGAPPAALMSAARVPVLIPLQQIAPGENARQAFTDIAELAAQIKQYGVLNPIQVRRRRETETNDVIYHALNGVAEIARDGSESDSSKWDEADVAFVIVAGERRYRASILAGEEFVPAFIEDDFSRSRGAHGSAPFDAKQEAMLHAMENFARVDLSPIEKAKAFHMLERVGWSHEQIASELGFGQRAFITKHLGLLDLPADVQQMIQTGQLSYSHGVLLGSKEIPEALVRSWANVAAEQAWPTARLEATVRNWREQRKAEEDLAAPPLDMGASGLPEASTPIGAAEISVAPEGANRIGTAKDALEGNASQGHATAESHSQDELEIEAEQDDSEPLEIELQDQKESVRTSDATNTLQPSPIEVEAKPSIQAPPPPSAASSAPIIDKRSSAEPASKPAVATSPPKSSSNLPPPPPPPAPASAAPSLPAGWTMAAVRTSDYEKAQELGLWPLATAIEVISERYELHPDAVEAANWLTHLYNTGGDAQMALTSPAKAILTGLFPDAAADGSSITPEMIASTLLVLRRRNAAGSAADGWDDGSADETELSDEGKEH